MITVNETKIRQSSFSAIEKAIQRKMDEVAKERGYDSLLSACSYASAPDGDVFKDEGMAFVAWRSATWQLAIQTQARVTAGEIPMPTVEQAIADMPALVLP